MGLWHRGWGGTAAVCVLAVVTAVTAASGCTEKTEPPQTSQTQQAAGAGYPLFVYPKAFFKTGREMWGTTESWWRFVANQLGVPVPPAQPCHDRDFETKEEAMQCLLANDPFAPMLVSVGELQSPFFPCTPRTTQGLSQLCSS